MRKLFTVIFVAILAITLGLIASAQFSKTSNIHVSVNGEPLVIIGQADFDLDMYCGTTQVVPITIGNNMDVDANVHWYMNITSTELGAYLEGATTYDYTIPALGNTTFDWHVFVTEECTIASGDIILTCTLMGE